jgi:hypothetical protein
MELHRSNLSTLSQRQWLAIAAFACVALTFYFICYWNDPNLPGKSELGWWGWFDQGQYYRSVVALEQNNYEPSEHHYPIGYPLIGTLFYGVMPQHPFLVPNLVSYGLICFAFLQLCRVFVSFEWALILCFFGVVWPTTVQANLIYPWTSTPVNAALMVMAYLALARTPDRLNGICTGICAGLIFMVRPGDLVYSWPLMAVLWLGCRGWREVWQRATWFLAGALPLVGLASYFSIAIHGHLVSEGYRKATVYIGFSFESLGVKLYTFFVDAFPIFGEKRNLVVVFPVVLFILPGVVTFVKELKWRGIAVVAAQLGAVAYFLAYNDYWVSNAFKFHGVRVWLWLIPFVGLYAYLTFRLAWRSLGWVATALLLVGPLVFWDAVGMEIRPVFWEPAPVADSGCPAKVTPASDLSDDDATTGWRCEPGADGSCSMVLEFRKAAEFDMLTLEGIPSSKLLYANLWLDGQPNRMFYERYSSDGPDGRALLIFYRRQTARSLRLTIPPPDAGNQLWVSEVRLYVRSWKFSPRNPLTRYHPSLATRFNADFLTAEQPNGITALSGLSGIEGARTRWAEGPETSFSFSLPASRPLELLVAATDSIPRQSVEVVINQKTAAVLRYADEMGQAVGARIRFNGTAGRNTVAFHYADWNHGRTTFASGDSRLLAVNFQRLAVRDLSSVARIEGEHPQVSLYGVERGSDLLFTPQPGVLLSGFSTVETEDTKPGRPRHRWGLGPASRVTFALPSTGCIGFEITFVSPDPETAVTVIANGKAVDHVQSPKALLTPATLRIIFEARQGQNLLEFQYSRWNHKDGKAFAAGDPRQMAIDFVSLRLLQP